MSGEQSISGSTPAGNAPAPSNPAPPSPEFDRGTPSSFVRARVNQMTTPQPAPSDNAPAQDRRQQQQSPQEAMVRFADGSEYKESDLLAALGERAEAASRKATLPSSPDGYEIKLPDGFQAPEGVRFEFDKNDPALKSARELAHKHGISQDVLSEMLGVYASTKMGEAIRNAQMRDVNMKQLGAAGPQRVEAVATWLQARAGAEGKAFGNFLRQFPSAPIVKATEALMRAFSNQGGADFSQSHRAQEDDQGRIPGYDNMSFVEKRAHQMARMLSQPGAPLNRLGLNRLSVSNPIGIAAGNQQPDKAKHGLPSGRPRVVNEPANRQGQQIYFGIAATVGHDADLACNFERNPPLLSHDLVIRQHP